MRAAGLRPGIDEFKSSARMDANAQMRAARENLLRLAGDETRVGVFYGPHERGSLGKHSLQALQSILVRNGIPPSRLDVYFDEGIFPTNPAASRLHALFHHLRHARLHPRAHSFGQILKAELSGTPKLVDIGGPGTGYAQGTQAPLAWHLLMRLRYALMTRPMIQNGGTYKAATDPVVLDPLHDDPVIYGQHPIMLGWGIQIAPESDEQLRQAVERALGRLWLGCIH
jgi:hypothetical protein